MLNELRQATREVGPVRMAVWGIVMVPAAIIVSAALGSIAALATVPYLLWKKTPGA